jgi:hypothetical protein
MPGPVMLGRLDPVDLRGVWEREDTGFTPWLAQPENIAQLGETIGLELQVEAQEKDVGSFRADILCKETTSNRWVLIENQLEATDHGHLGQLFTYAAGLGATAVIWIAAEFRDEHRAALDWLNEITGESCRFFGIEIQLWKIGASPAAPRFNLVSKPNDWTKSSTEKIRGELTPTKQIQIDYWTAFAKFLVDRKSTVKATKPLPQNWMTMGLGRSGFVLTAIASSWDSEGGAAGGELRAEVVITNDEAKQYFAVLEAQRAQIDAELGSAPTWYNPSNARNCKVFFRKAADIANKADWPNQHEWLQAHLELLQKVLGPRVKTVALAPSVAEGAGG